MNQQGSGLFAGGAAVPLQGVQIEVNAVGVATTVVVSQRYRNTERVPVEAVYTFPLPESAAVCGFSAQIGERRIVGEVLEREAAFDKYDDAMAGGHGAFLLDQDRPNIFTASVGNLLPQQEIVVRIEFVMPLEQRGDEMRLLLPTSVAPRYVPLEDAVSREHAELERLNPPRVMGAVPYGLSLSATFDALQPIASVAVPSHPAEVQIDTNRAQVTLMGRAIQLDQDFVISLTLRERQQATAVVGRDEKGRRAAMLNFFPDLSSLPRQAVEVVFLVDRSGSMDGASIDQARNALLLSLRSLEEGDLFNLVGFGSSFQSLFPRSVGYTQATLDQATAHAQGISANLGGTELLPPLQQILSQPLQEGRPRQLIVLTDGEVSNDAECIALAERHRESTRIFTFGVGYGASEYLVRGLARASRGEAEMIHPNERIESKVMRQFGRLTRPALKNLRVRWDGLTTGIIAPAEVPPLFDGDRVTLYAELTGASAGSVRIDADGPQGPLALSLAVDPEHSVLAPAVPTLMARAAIADLEAGQSGQQRGSNQRERREQRNKERLVALSCQYGLLSSATSFVAVEQREASEAAPAELRRIPIAMTKGWHDWENKPIALGGLAVPMAGRTPAPMAPGAMTGSFAPPPMQLAASAPESASEREGGFFRKLFSRPMRRAKQAVMADLDGYAMAEECDDAVCEASATVGMRDHESGSLLALTTAQKVDGRWELTADLVRFAGHELSRLQQLAQGLTGADAATRDAVVATVLALHLLCERFSAENEQWELLAEKAKRWLAKTGVAIPSPHASFDAWLVGVL